MNFLELSNEQRKLVISQASAKEGISANLVEKDWWICQVLKALYTLPCAEHISFKGGTSLSKCWKLIERFSEDVDIAIDREFLGFSGKLSKTQISDKLRRAACSYVREKLQYKLRDALIENGIDANSFSVHVNITPITTTDPEIIEVEYPSLFDANQYIRNVVKIEVSGRSMSEPVAEKELNSIVNETFPNAIFAEKGFTVRAVLPDRTFLEKIFLLHEEFSKPTANIRVERMSRHMYDIGQILKTPIAERALMDKDLYCHVVLHRKTFIGLRGFDYATLSPQRISILPPQSVANAWRSDYEQMRTTMIYGESMTFEQLLQKLHLLNERIKQLDYEIPL